MICKFVKGFATIQGAFETETTNLFDVVSEWVGCAGYIADERFGIDNSCLLPCWTGQESMSNMIKMLTAKF